MGKQAVGKSESEYKNLGQRPQVQQQRALYLGFQSPISCNRRSVSRPGLPEEGNMLQSLSLTMHYS